MGTINAATGVQQIDNAHAIPRPLFNLVEVAGIRNQRVVGLLVGPVAHGAGLQTGGGKRRGVAVGRDALTIKNRRLGRANLTLTC